MKCNPYKSQLPILTSAFERWNASSIPELSSDLLAWHTTPQADSYIIILLELVLKGAREWGLEDYTFLHLCWLAPELEEAVFPAHSQPDPSDLQPTKPNRVNLQDILHPERSWASAKEKLTQNTHVDKSLLYLQAVNTFHHIEVGNTSCRSTE
jgi:hypothetical protein